MAIVRIGQHHFATPADVIDTFNELAELIYNGPIERTIGTLLRRYRLVKKQDADIIISDEPVAGSDCEFKIVLIPEYKVYLDVMMNGDRFGIVDPNLGEAHSPYSKLELVTKMRAYRDYWLEIIESFNSASYPTVFYTESGVYFQRMTKAALLKYLVSDLLINENIGSLRHYSGEPYTTTVEVRHSDGCAKIDNDCTLRRIGDMVTLICDNNVVHDSNLDEMCVVYLKYWARKWRRWSWLETRKMEVESHD